MRALITIVILFTLASCSQTVKSIKVDNIHQTTQASDAYLLMGVDTSQDLKAIEISGTQNIALSHTDIRAGSNYILIPIKSGKYQIDNIRLNSMYRIELVSEYWSFNIEPNSINYAGHLEIVKSGFFFSTTTELILKNRASEALRYIEESFPQLEKTSPLVYSGPGEDDFFNLVREGKKDVQ